MFPPVAGALLASIEVAKELDKVVAISVFGIFVLL